MPLYPFFSLHSNHPPHHLHLKPPVSQKKTLTDPFPLASSPSLIPSPKRAVNHVRTLAAISLAPLSLPLTIRTSCSPFIHLTLHSERTLSASRPPHAPQLLNTLDLPHPLHPSQEPRSTRDPVAPLTCRAASLLPSLALLARTRGTPPSSRCCRSVDVRRELSLEPLKPSFPRLSSEEELPWSKILSAPPEKGAYFISRKLISRQLYRTLNVHWLNAPWR